MNVRRPQGPLVYKNPFLAELKTKSSASSHKRDSSPRAGHLVKVPPTRPTRTICQERFACNRPLRVAVYDCTDCRTLQCDACETLIHENPKYLFHDRKKLQFPSDNIICELKCETRNLADVFCKVCNKRLCFACDLIAHQYKSAREHYRVPFELDEFFSLPQGQASLHHVATKEDYQSWNDQEFLSVIPQEDSLEVENTEEDRNSFYKSILERSPNSSTLDSSDSDHSRMMPMQTIPDVLSSTEGSLGHKDKDKSIKAKSFLLVNDKEMLEVKSEEEFTQLLGCKSDSPLKVVSIFGNTGEGKSYTLNYTFFNGDHVFSTNDTQESCTVGIWAAYDGKFDLLILDTEGMLGLTENPNKRTRLLMKILALSDIIIYRTRAERLHNDLFTFLGDASEAYIRHFSKELEAAKKRFNVEGSVSSLGPAVIIFHETINTKILTTNNGKKPEDQLKERFRECNLPIHAFNKIEYVGTQTKFGPTSFEKLAESVQNTLLNCTMRSTRSPVVIYQLLKALNDKFNGAIDNTFPSSFLLEYLTCNTYCQSCNVRCVHSTNHTSEGIAHSSTENCKYQHQFDNKIYLCRKCYESGESTVQVIPKTSASEESTWLGLVKYAWSGYVIECPKCGVIYRSREYWYGNKDPCESAVRTEVCHVWPGGFASSQLNPNVARRVIDSVTTISDAVSSISSKPTKTITSWVADQFAPSYWKPNYSITHCEQCNKEFTHLDKKHHCRSCGHGFCEDCSSKKRPVPERGWGTTPVRVCDSCAEEERHDSPSITDEPTVTARKVGEVIHGAIETVAMGINYPIGFIKDSARPSYWVADENITNCSVCKNAFSLKLPLHHCRACGQGVCENCSGTLKPVLSRGWDYPVRVCDECVNKPDL